MGWDRKSANWPGEGVGGNDEIGLGFIRLRLAVVIYELNLS